MRYLPCSRQGCRRTTCRWAGCVLAKTSYAPNGYDGHGGAFKCHEMLIFQLRRPLTSGVMGRSEGNKTSCRIHEIP